MTRLTSFSHGSRQVRNRRPAWLGQYAHANAGRAADIYFYRDHYGNEVDFVIPEGEKLRLFECKWLETPPSQVKAFDEIAKLAGEANVVSRSLFTPVHGARFLRDRRLHIQDCVDFSALASAPAD